MLSCSIFLHTKHTTWLCHQYYTLSVKPTTYHPPIKFSFSSPDSAAFQPRISFFSNFSPLISSSNCSYFVSNFSNSLIRVYLSCYGVDFLIGSFVFLQITRLAPCLLLNFSCKIKLNDSMILVNCMISSSNFKSVTRNWAGLDGVWDIFLNPGNHLFLR